MKLYAVLKPWNEVIEKSKGGFKSSVDFVEDVVFDKSMESLFDGTEWHEVVEFYDNFRKAIILNRDGIEYVVPCSLIDDLKVL